MTHYGDRHPPNPLSGLAGTCVSNRVDDIEAGALIGTASEVIERIIAEAQALSLSHLSCFMRLADMPHDVAMRSIESFGTEVIPAVQRAMGGGA